jgi:hypothetical protein
MRDYLKGKRPLWGRPHGNGDPVVVRGRESRPHGEAGQVGGWPAREVRDMRDAETTLAIVRGRGTVSSSKALNWKDVLTFPSDDPTDGEHGVEITPRIESTGEPCARKPASTVRREAAEPGIGKDQESYPNPTRSPALTAYPTQKSVKRGLARISHPEN